MYLICSMEEKKESERGVHTVDIVCVCVDWLMFHHKRTKKCFPRNTPDQSIFTDKPTWLEIDMETGRWNVMRTSERESQTPKSQRKDK